VIRVKHAGKSGPCRHKQKVSVHRKVQQVRGSKKTKESTKVPRKITMLSIRKPTWMSRDILHSVPEEQRHSADDDFAGPAVQEVL